MIYESSNWTVTRRMGIGDREHVRTHLLSIGCFHSRHLLYAVEACYKAGAELGMMARVHINAAREHPVVLEHIVRLVHRFMQFDAQLMEHGFIDQPRFEKIFETCDLVIQPKGEPNLNVDAYVDELVTLIKHAWRSSGERFLGGNFARLTDAELQQLHPDLYPNSTSFYQDFTNADSI